MSFMAEKLAASGVLVCRFDFPYVQRGRRAPDRLPVLQSSFAAVASKLHEDLSNLPLFLGGKSLGGRVASHVVAAGFPATGLLFFGYPLHPPGRPDRIRDAHLRDIEAPMLFVEGTRDPFCPLKTLRRVVSTLSAEAEIAVIGDGNHSLEVRKSSGRSTEQAWQEAATRAAQWMDRVSTARGART